MIVAVAALAFASAFSPRSGGGAVGSSVSNTIRDSNIANESLLVSVLPIDRLLAPGISGNFTMNIFPFGNYKGTVQFSAILPSGFSIKFDPASLILSGKAQSVDLRIQASASQHSGSYPVRIRVMGPPGALDEVFEFHVIEHLIQIGGTPNTWIPANLTVIVGTTVTWVNLDSGGEDNSGAHSVTFLNANLSSPILLRNNLWSYTFKMPGVYQYYDSLNSTVGGEIVVVG